MLKFFHYLSVLVVDLPQGWEMNISGGRPYYVEYKCFFAVPYCANVTLNFSVVDMLYFCFAYVK